MITFLSVSFSHPGDMWTFNALLKQTSGTDSYYKHILPSFTVVPKCCRKTTSRVVWKSLAAGRGISRTTSTELSHAESPKALLPLPFPLSCSRHQEVRVELMSLVHSPLVPSPWETPSQLHSPAGQPASPRLPSAAVLPALQQHSHSRGRHCLEMLMLPFSLFTTETSPPIVTLRL